MSPVESQVFRLIPRDGCLLGHAGSLGHQQTGQNGTPLFLRMSLHQWMYSVVLQEDYGYIVALAMIPSVCGFAWRQ